MSSSGYTNANATVLNHDQVQTYPENRYLDMTGTSSVAPGGSKTGAENVSYPAPLLDNLSHSGSVISADGQTINHT